MLGLALEGGGAKGAYHIGAVMACMEVGVWPPDVAAGTSIGAMNAAMIAQGDFEAARELWQRVGNEDVFSADDQKLIEANFRSMDLAGLADMIPAIRKLISDGGVDNSNMRAIVARYIHPEKLMASPMDFGLVTFRLPDFTAVEIFKEDMGAENIPVYILASAAFPGFQRVRLGDKTFVDGGVYDNCPVNMLLERGCDRVIAVRTNAVGITRYDDSDSRVTTIRPSEELGSLMRFSPQISQHNIQLGYYDGLKALLGLEGRRYYLTDSDLGPVSRLLEMPDELILELGRLMRVGGRMDPKRMLFERVLPLLFYEMDMERGAGYEELLVAMTEERAARGRVERLCLYTARELLGKALSSPSTGRKKNIHKAIDLILEWIFMGKPAPCSASLRF